MNAAIEIQGAGETERTDLALVYFRNSADEILDAGVFPFWILDFGFWIGGNTVLMRQSAIRNPRSTIVLRLCRPMSGKAVPFRRVHKTVCGCAALPAR